MSEKLITQVRSRPKNEDNATAYSIGVTANHVFFGDLEDKDTLDKKMEKVEEKIFASQPKEVTLAKIQEHLDNGTIEDYCKVGDYVDLTLSPPTLSAVPDQRFYIIGINGHNGQGYNGVVRDHVDFYGGQLRALKDKEGTAQVYVGTTGKLFDINNYATSTKEHKYQESNFYKYIKGQITDSGKTNTFFGTSNLNFVPKRCFFDKKANVSENTILKSIFRAFELIDNNAQDADVQQKKEALTNIATELDPYEQGTLRQNLKEEIVAFGFGDMAVAPAMLRVAVSLVEAVKDFEKAGPDVSLACQRLWVGNANEQNYLVLYKFCVDLHNYINKRIKSSKAATGVGTSIDYIWLLTESEIDGTDIMGTPHLSSTAGYQYPFFQNKQFFKNLFSFADDYMYSMTPVHGTTDKMVGWTWNKIGNATVLSKTKVSCASGDGNDEQPAVANNCTGFGFRIAAQSN